MTTHILTNLYHNGKPCIITGVHTPTTKGKALTTFYKVCYGTHYGRADSLDDIVVGDETILGAITPHGPKRVDNIDQSLV